MPAHKLTRKQLKQDSFVDYTSKAVDFLQDHYLKLAVGILAVVVIIVGFSYVQKGQETSRERASFLLYQGENLLTQGAYIPARESLQECVDRFGGTLFGKAARLDLAHVHMSLGDNQLALSTLEEALGTTSPTDPLYDDLRAFQAVALANLGRYGEAEEVYRNLLASDLPDYRRLELSLELAEVLKDAGRPSESSKLLKELMEAAERGEVKIPPRNLETQVQVYEALAQAS